MTSPSQDRRATPTIGTWLTLNSVSVAEVLADAAFDWLCIDMEHSPTDYAEAQAMIMAIQGRGKKAFVRVGENNPRIIKRVLDAGAQGIIVPLVNTAEEARREVAATRYPPRGTRGVGLARAQAYGVDFEGYRDTRSHDLTVIAQIEHIEAVKNLASILEIDGIDGTFIGPYDLSGSLGMPGDWSHPLVQSALADYETTARRYNKRIGAHVIETDPVAVRQKMARGYDFIAYSLDAMLLGTAARDHLQTIRAVP